MAGRRIGSDSFGRRAEECRFAEVSLAPVATDFVEMKSWNLKWKQYSSNYTSSM